MESCSIGTRCKVFSLPACLPLCFLNNWNAPAGVSFAFYVHPEGLLSGVIYQLGSAFAVKAVSKVGLGIYYTVHEFSNVGVTVLIGFVGPALGFPAKAPSNIPLALFGIVLIGLGMVPTMFIEDVPEKQTVGIESSAHAEGLDVEGPDSALLPPSTKSKVPPSLADVYFPMANIEEDTAVAYDPPDLKFEAALSLGNLSWNALSWSKMMQANAHTWDGSHVPKSIKPTLDHFHHITSSLPSVPLIIDSDSDADDEEEDKTLFSITESEVSYVRQVTPRTEAANSRWDKTVGLIYSLVAGGLFGVMFAPMPVWKQRMARAGIDATSADFVFAVCVGASMFSSANLGFWSSVKKIKKQKLVKSVLRPALSAGIIYYFAMLFQFRSMELLPYAVGYVSCTGLALAVSMVWGIAVFGEMQGNHNRLMAGLSFLGVISGALAMAGAA